MDGQDRPPLNADDLDGELRDALRVDPPAEFRSRVRARVAHESMRPRWVAAAPLALAASLVIVAGAFVLMGDVVDERPVQQIAAGRDVTLAAMPETAVARTGGEIQTRPASKMPLPLPVAPTQSATVARTLSDPRPPARPRVPVGGEPEVLLSASEQAGVRLLFESAASGRLQLPPEMLRDLSLPLADFESTIEGDNQ